MFRISVCLCLFCTSEIAFAETLVDPTRPIAIMSNNVSTSFNKRDKLSLSSIMINSLNQGYAIINNRSYRLGEKVQGVEIVKINKDYLLLADGRKLVVFKSIIKKQGS